VNLEPEADAILRRYIGQRKWAGRFLARLLYEHDARMQERAKLAPAAVAVVGASEEAGEP
jgi:hypothetical protein